MSDEPAACKHSHMHAFMLDTTCTTAVYHNWQATMSTYGLVRAAVASVAASG
jgi:hypothetical protein